MKIKFVPREQLKTKPDFTNLGFGKVFTDYMFVMDYHVDKGWFDPRIVPYGPISMEPCCMVLHYGQEVFEGMKAYHGKDGKINLFRPEMNARRMNDSNDRLCMPHIEEKDFIRYVNELVKLERAWIPNTPNSSLYIRPFIFASDEVLGVHVSKTYKFMIILSPSGSYYSSDKVLKGVKIYVEDEYVRAVRGGTGATKCGGNYGGSLIAQDKANKMGYDQVLWLDGVENKYVEEIGAMNVMFLVEDEVLTCNLNGSVLPGITRDSCLELLRNWNHKVFERKVSIEEIIDAAKTGRLKEAWGTGTAAVVSPIGKLIYKGDEYTIGNGDIGPLTLKLYETITGIQKGLIEDTFGWTYEVK